MEHQNADPYVKKTFCHSSLGKIHREQLLCRRKSPNLSGHPYFFLAEE